jgi:competence protein ComEC
VQPAPPLWAVLLGLSGVVVLLLPRGFPGRHAGLALLLPALLPAVETPRPGEAWIDVLDVGQGQASVVRTAGHVLVFDTGPRFAPTVDAGQRIVLPVLRAAGVGQIDALLVSHQDSDHSGGAASLVEALPIGWSSSSLPEAHALRARLPAHRRCLAGDAWQWDGVRFTVLHPSAAEYAAAEQKPNHLSCVLRVDAGRRSMLLTADIEAADEAALLARAAPLAADVLQVPHHGSRSSSTPAFLAAVGAGEIVTPVGYLNRFNHPHPLVVARYAASGARHWRTDRDGALRVRLGDNVQVEAWRQLAPRYWFGR